MVLDQVAAHVGDVLLGVALAVAEMVADWISQLCVEILERILA